MSWPPWWDRTRTIIFSLSPPHYLPHWPRDRFIELAPRYWRITRARLRRDELDREVGWLTIPEPPLPTMMPVSVPAEPRPLIAP